jgi:UPF0716 protein FxsA
VGKYLFLAFTLGPLVELYLLLLVGQHVGLWPTVGLVFFTGLLGAVLAKQEGLRVVRRWQESVAQGRMPEEGILGGALVLVGGVLLITPGVLTDLAGLLLLLPPTRRWVAARVRRALERRMAAGTLRVTTFRTESFSGGPFQARPDVPLRGNPHSSHEERPRGVEDAEFTEKEPER